MLELRDVVKRYETGDEIVRAVDHVSLTVAPGGLVALYGPSGSGKSTLLQLAAGLTAPDAGEVLFNGRDVAHLSVRDATRYLRADVGIIWQQFHLLPLMPAIDNIGIKLVAAGMSRGAARARARVWLDRVGLAERCEHPPERLSTGEQQRVAIARALVNEPGLILADEPTGNLDTRRAKEILQLLADICHDGVAVLLVTHDPEAAAVADRVLTLRDGQLVDGHLPASDAQSAAGEHDGPTTGAREC